MTATEPFGESADRHDLRETTRRLLARHLPAAEALRCDRDGEFSRDTWRALGAAGLLGIGAPAESGGSDGTVGDALAVVEEIAAVLPSLAVDYVLAGMSMRLLPGLNGPAGPWLPGIAAGTYVASFALSEPGAGTDLLNLRTSARREGEDLVLRGQKTWITLASEADVLFVLARTEPVEQGRRGRGLSLIAVPVTSTGLTIHRINLAGMRAAVSCDVFLDEVRVPATHILGESGAALPLLARTLDVERILAAGISLGIGRAALDLTIVHLATREAFGAAIGRLQALQHPAADSLAELTAARALVNLAVQAAETAKPTQELAAMAKLQAAEGAARIVDRGMRAMGAMGLAEESAMQMYFRDARLQLFSPVSNEMVRNLLGEHLGLPRSY